MAPSLHVVTLLLWAVCAAPLVAATSQFVFPPTMQSTDPQIPQNVSLPIPATMLAAVFGASGPDSSYSGAYTMGIVESTSTGDVPVSDPDSVMTCDGYSTIFGPGVFSIVNGWSNNPDVQCKFHLIGSYKIQLSDPAGVVATGFSLPLRVVSASANYSGYLRIYSFPLAALPQFTLMDSNSQPATLEVDISPLAAPYSTTFTFAQSPDGSNPLRPSLDYQCQQNFPQVQVFSHQSGSGAFISANFAMCAFQTTGVFYPVVNVSSHGPIVGAPIYINNMYIQFNRIMPLPVNSLSNVMFPVLSGSSIPPIQFSVQSVGSVAHMSTSTVSTAQSAVSFFLVSRQFPSSTGQYTPVDAVASTKVGATQVSCSSSITSTVLSNGVGVFSPSSSCTFASDDGTTYDRGVIIGAKTTVDGVDVYGFTRYYIQVAAPGMIGFNWTPHPISQNYQVNASFTLGFSASDANGNTVTSIAHGYQVSVRSMSDNGAWNPTSANNYTLFSCASSLTGNFAYGIASLSSCTFLPAAANTNVAMCVAITNAHQYSSCVGLYIRGTSSDSPPYYPHIPPPDSAMPMLSWGIPPPNSTTVGSPFSVRADFTAGGNYITLPLSYSFSLYSGMGTPVSAADAGFSCPSSNVLSGSTTQGWSMLQGCSFSQPGTYYFFVQFSDSHGNASAVSSPCVVAPRTPTLIWTNAPPSVTYAGSPFDIRVDLYDTTGLHSNDFTFYSFALYSATGTPLSQAAAGFSCPSGQMWTTNALSGTTNPGWAMLSGCSFSQPGTYSFGVHFGNVTSMSTPCTVSASPVTALVLQIAVQTSPSSPMTSGTSFSIGQFSVKAVNSTYDVVAFFNVPYTLSLNTATDGTNAPVALTCGGGASTGSFASGYAYIWAQSCSTPAPSTSPYYLVITAGSFSLVLTQYPITVLPVPAQDSGTNTSAHTGNNSNANDSWNDSSFGNVSDSTGAPTNGSDLNGSSGASDDAAPGLTDASNASSGSANASDMVGPTGSNASTAPPASLLSILLTSESVKTVVNATLASFVVFVQLTPSSLSQTVAFSLTKDTASSSPIDYTAYMTCPPSIAPFQSVLVSGTASVSFAGCAFSQVGTYFVVASSGAITAESAPIIISPAEVASIRFNNPNFGSYGMYGYGYGYYSSNDFPIMTSAGHLNTDTMVCSFTLLDAAGGVLSGLPNLNLYTWRVSLIDSNGYPSTALTSLSNPSLSGDFNGESVFLASVPAAWAGLSLSLWSISQPGSYTVRVSVFRAGLLVKSASTSAFTVSSGIANRIMQANAYFATSFAMNGPSPVAASSPLLQGYVRFRLLDEMGRAVGTAPSLSRWSAFVSQSSDATANASAAVSSSVLQCPSAPVISGTVTAANGFTSMVDLAGCSFTSVGTFYVHVTLPGVNALVSYPITVTAAGSAATHSASVHGAFPLTSATPFNLQLSLPTLSFTTGSVTVSLTSSANGGNAISASAAGFSCLNQGNQLLTPSTSGALTGTFQSGSAYLECTILKAGDYTIASNLTLSGVSSLASSSVHISASSPADIKVLRGLLTSFIVNTTMSPDPYLAVTDASGNVVPSGSIVTPWSLQLYQLIGVNTWQQVSPSQVGFVCGSPSFTSPLVQINPLVLSGCSMTVPGVYYLTASWGSFTATSNAWEVASSLSNSQVDTTFADALSWACPHWNAVCASSA